MRPPQLLLAAAIALVCFGAGAPQAKTPLQGARHAFEIELGRQCPGERLQDLSPGDLDLIMEGFQSRFTPAQTRQVQDAVGYRCARIEAGLTCANNASLDTYRRLGLLKAFTREACAAGWTCKGFADCSQAPR